MMLRSPIQQRLTLLLLLLCVGFTPSFVRADDIYLRAEQTDKDYEPERIEELIGLIESAKGLDRSSALWDLNALGPEARPAIPNLIEMLSDKSMLMGNVSVNNSASRSLSLLEAEGVEPLVKAFPEASPEVQRMIANTATYLGGDARELLPLFRNEYDPEDEKSRLTYLIAIASIDRTGETALPLLLKALQSSPHEWDRRFAAQCLSRHKTRPEWPDCFSLADQWMQRNLQSSEQVVKVLLQALDDEDAGVRAEAIRALATFSKHEQEIVPALLPRLADESVFSIVLIDVVYGELVSKVTFRELRHFPDAAEKTVPALVEWVSNADRSSVFQAEEVLAELIPLTANPLEHVEKILQGKNPELAFLTLAYMGDRSAPLIERLEEFADSENSDVALKAKLTLACIDERWHFPVFGLLEEEYAAQRLSNFKKESTAFTFLANVGRNASFATPVVRRCLKMIAPDSEIYSSTNSLYVNLVQIMSNSSTAEPSDIALILANDYISFVETVEASLIEMWPHAEPGLIAHLRNPACPTRHRILCLRVLAAAHAENPELVPLIVAQLQSNHPAVRESAVEALGGIGAKNDESLQALIKALDDPRVRVRAKALESLARFGDKAGPAIPQIIERLSDDYLTVRVAAVRCLGKLGKTAEAGVERLNTLSDSESVLIRDLAREALSEIRGD